MTEVDGRENILPDFEIATNQEIVDFFKQKPNLKELYESDSGVWQDYTLEEHTLMMMGQFDRYFSNGFFSSVITRGQFKVMLALHDIGKPAAVKELGKDKGRHNQHEYTARIIPGAIKDLGFDVRVEGLVSFIPTQDIMGKFLRKHKDEERNKVIYNYTPEEAAVRIKQESAELGINSSDLFYLISAYFMSDASSYTLDADPDMEIPPPGHESLDHLFIFDRKPGEEKGKLEFVPDLKQRMEALESQLTLN